VTARALWLYDRDLHPKPIEARRTAGEDQVDGEEIEPHIGKLRLFLR
jgi:hypothetical protein